MNAVEKHYKKMTETPVHKLILRLGLPTTVSMLITNVYNLTDTYFVGTLGESAQGATGVLFTLQAIIQAFAFMLGHGSGTYVSKALAEKNGEEASRYSSTAFFTGGTIGILILTLGMIFMNPFLRLLGSSETILPHARDYCLWVLVACPFMICSLILNNNLRYEGMAIYSMVGLTTGGVLNIFGDFLLIRVLKMGVFGAGLATTTSQVVSFLILLILYVKKSSAKITPRAFTFDFAVHLNIVKGGLPSLIRQGLASLSNGILNNLAKPFGDAAIAAISVVNRFSSLVLAIGIGIGQGFQPVAAFNYSAGMYKRVKKGLLFTWGFSTVLVSVISVFGIIFAPQIIWVFQKNQSVIDIGATALRFASVGLMFLSSSTCANMLFQSIRRAGVASLLAMLRSGLIFIPVLILGHHFFALLGIQAAQGIADVLSGLISIPFAIHFLKTDHKDSNI